MKLPVLSRELIIASRLADPVTRYEIDCDQSIRWTEVLRILARSKVPLLSLSRDTRMAGCPLMDLPAFQELAIQEEHDWNVLRNEYSKVRESFLNKGIPSILFKSVGLPPSFPYTSDNLDTLVPCENLEIARAILYDLGYVELRNVEEPEKLLFRKFSAGVSISAIHLHGLVGWGVPFLDDVALWQHYKVSEDDPLVLVPGPEDGLLITLAHALYENKSIKLLDLIRIRACLRCKELDLANVERVAQERGWADGLAFGLVLCAHLEEWLFGSSLLPQSTREHMESALADNSWLKRRLESTLDRNEVKFPFRISFTFGKVLYYKKVFTDSKRSTWTRLNDVIRTLAWGAKLKLRIRGQRGALVTLSGVDGSGKTTHAERLLSTLEICDLKAVYVWSRCGVFPWLKIFRLASQSSNLIDPNQDTASVLARRRRRLQNPIMRVTWIFLSLADLVVRYNFEVRLHRLIGDVVVCDRYIYDAIVEMHASLPDCTSWATIEEKLLFFLCPKPNIAWSLDCPREIGVTRKSDENRETNTERAYEDLRLMYGRLASRYGLKVLDTSGKLDATTNQLVNETLRQYYRDCATWTNALLLSNPDQMNP